MTHPLGSIQLITETEAAIVYRMSCTQVKARIAQGFLVYAGTTLAGVHLYRTNV